MIEAQHNSRGMILVVVLWSVALMSIVVIALSVYAQRSLLTASVEADRLRSEMGLRAAVNVGAAIVLATPELDRVFLAGESVPVDLGGGKQARIALREASGLIDINRMDGEYLQNAIGAVTGSADAAAEIASAILERRKLAGGDGKSSRSSGSGQEGEQSADGEEGGKQQAPPAFTSVAELYGLAVSDRDAVAKLKPFAGLFSQDGRINPFAAPEDVLRAVPGIRPEDLALVEQGRRRKDRDSPQMQQLFAKYVKYLAVPEGSAYIVEARLAGGDGLIAGSRVTATIILDTSGTTAFRVLTWSW